MLDRIKLVKRKLNESIEQLNTVSWMFIKHPERDFSRIRKLPFPVVVSFLLTIEGGTLTTELLKYFGYSSNIASASAFVQQRKKISHEAFSSLFDLFVRKTQPTKLYKGYRLLAVDGSDIQVPNNPNHSASHYPGANGQAPYNLLHLDALYDLQQHTYQDACLLGDREANECDSACKMVDRSSLNRAILIADRGYESFNLMAHVQEKGWKYLFRVKDLTSLGGISCGLNLPDTAEFDITVNLSLTRKQTNSVKDLLKQKNMYRFIPHGSRFDYLPLHLRKKDPTIFYNLPFRIARFKITNDSYEMVVTNLDADAFPTYELKKLYAMRWGIETSFRELKYTVGLLHFHAKKVEYIYQEIFARLIMYNFAELITSSVIIPKSDSKYAYQANFTIAVHVCRQFLLGNVSPPNLETVIRRNVSPIRPGRSRPRNTTVKHPVSFIYRIA